MIPCGNPHAQYVAHKREIDEAVVRVLDRGRYVLGPEVSAFEAEFADYIGTSHAIGVGSGTEALHVALAACGIGPGDEVITVSHTAVATVAAIELAGAEAVLADIEPAYFTLDPAVLASLVTPKTKAIVPVHLYGQSADMTGIIETARRLGLRIIEDCAQATGARYKGRRVGSFGDMACFSFYPTKNLGALGDGGMVVTGNGELARQARLLREYGWAERCVSHFRGWNSRLDELQAAVLRIKLRHLDDDNARRAAIAEHYDRELANSAVRTPQRRPGADHVYHLYVAQSDERDGLMEHLHRREIGALIHYPVPVHLQPAYLGRLRGCNRLPVTEQAAKEILSLPIYPELEPGDADRVIRAVQSYKEGDIP